MVNLEKQPLTVQGKMEICTHCQDFHKLFQLLWQEDSELTTRLEELRGLTMPAGTHTAKPLAPLPGEVIYPTYFSHSSVHTQMPCTSQSKAVTLLWLFEDELEAQKASDKGALLSSGWYCSIQAARAVSACFVPGILVPTLPSRPTADSPETIMCSA